jgi:hypothetical protein
MKKPTAEQITRAKSHSILGQKATDVGPVVPPVPTQGVSPVIETGMNLQGDALENWATKMLTEMAKVLKLPEDQTMGKLLAYAIAQVAVLPPNSATKNRAAELCAGLSLPVAYPDNWATKTLNDLGLVLGLPAGQTLCNLPVHAMKVMLEIELVQ